MSESKKDMPPANVARLPSAPEASAESTPPTSAQAELNDRWTRPRIALLALVCTIVVAAATVLWWTFLRVPPLVGFVSGNGRIEATEIDIATKFAGRVDAVLAEEGELVAAEQVLARIDVQSLDAQLDEAKAALQQTIEAHAATAAGFNRQDSLRRLALKEFGRAHQLLKAEVGSEENLDRRRTELETADASVEQVRRRLRQAEQTIEVAAARIHRLNIDIKDATLVAPRPGRVLYRLAEPGEVLGAGGKVLTIVEQGDAYMTIFLPEQQAAQVVIGADARIRLDGFDNKLWPASVSYVAPEAQFTPKQVETASEREKLVFKIKVQLPEPVAPLIKPGMRGLAYIRLDAQASWPETLP